MFSIDRGACMYHCTIQSMHPLSVLFDSSLHATAPHLPPDAHAAHGARPQVTGIPHPRGAPLDTSRIASIRMGTTVATNALLERKGET